MPFSWWCMTRLSHGTPCLTGGPTIGAVTIDSKLSASRWPTTCQVISGFRAINAIDAMTMSAPPMACGTMGRTTFYMSKEPVRPGLAHGYGLSKRSAMDVSAAATTSPSR